MDRQKFLYNYHKSDIQLDKKKVKKLIRKNVEKLRSDEYPYHNYIFTIIMEELSELIQAISKFVRHKSDKYTVLEEMADVQICIWYLQEAFGIETNDLYRAINVKIDRLEKSISEKGVYN